MSTYLINKFKPQFDIERKPRCLLYQISTTTEPRSWYIRVRRKNGTYFHQSTDLTNRADALRRGQEIYIEILAAENRGIVYGKNTFKRVFAEWFKKHKSGKARRNSIKSRYGRYLVFFDNYELHNINEDTFAKYLVWRLSYWENHTLTSEETGIGKDGRGGVYNIKKSPSAISLKQERQLLIQVLRWACGKSLLDNVPVINSDMRVYENNNGDIKGKINHKKTRGSPIPDKQLATIMGKMRHWAVDENVEKHREHRYARQRLYYFILITSHSLLRQGTEATRMKWEDLGRIKSKVDKDVWLYYFNVKEGKKQRYGADETIKFLTPDGLKHLLRWRTICQKEYGICLTDSEYIFPMLDGAETEGHYLSRLFRRQLLKWDEEGRTKAYKARKTQTKKYVPIAVDNEGRNITLYSFRHTKISKLLIHSGRSIAEVSRMADVSLIQLSRAYFKTQMLSDADRYADTSVNRNAVERVSEEEKEWIAETLKDLGM